MGTASKSKNQAILPLLVTFFLWGSIYVAGKLISNDIPSQLLAGVRCLVAAFPLMFMARKHFGVKIAREDRKWFLLVGFTGYFLTISLVQLGISLTGASMAALLNSLTPVAVTVMAAFILKERITPIKILCLFLALGGAVVVSSGATGQRDVVGIVVIMVSVLSWGVASVYMRRLTAKYPPIMVTAYGMTISLIFHLPASVVTAVSQPSNISLTTVLVVLYLGLVGSGVAQYTWTKCLSILPASTCSLFYPLQPVFSALLGVLILKETFSPTFFIGLLLISADVVLITMESRRESGK